VVAGPSDVRPTVAVMLLAAAVGLLTYGFQFWVPTLPAVAVAVGVFAMFGYSLVQQSHCVVHGQRVGFAPVAGTAMKACYTVISVGRRC